MPIFVTFKLHFKISMTQANSITNAFEEIFDAGQRMIKGYQTLQQIESIEVATTPKELVWEDDLVKLYHYKRDTPPKTKTPVLMSFAMINRHDVLDIQPDRSLMAKLLAEGLDIYIMDWGYPQPQHRYLTMEDYIDGFMNGAVDFIREKHGIDKIHQMGVCQGGTFSTIYAALYPEKIKSLTVYVTPFDFSKGECMLYKWAKNIDVDATVDAMGIIPASMLNQAFGMLKPSMEISKYFGLQDSWDDKEKVTNFLRMEQWKNDCPDVAGEMYRKYIKDLFQDNKLILGTFELGGRKVDLKKVTMPFLNVYATQDNIIPNSSTIAIQDKLGSTDKELYPFPGGHIGVFVGGKSQKELAPAVAKWVISKG